MPQRHLEQVMQALVRADILRGVRGPRGGYRLARERRRISVREIFEVIEAIDANEDGAASKSQLGAEIIAPFHGQLQNALIEAVGDTTIADLCANANKGNSALTGTLPGGADDSDFTI